MNVNRVLFFKSNDSQKFYSSNKPGDFTTKIIPALDLEDNSQYFIALDHISMAASWYNLRPEYENTKLRISKDKGANFSEIIFPAGVYAYEDINEFIHQKIGQLSGSDDYGIDILFDFSTYKVFVKLDENYQIDFVGSGNFHDLLGFDQQLLKGSAFGQRLPNITNSIDNIYLRCSLLSNSILAGERSDVLFTFPTNTKVRALPFKEHPIIDYLWNEINTKYISEIRFWLTDDKDRKVDLNGIDIAIAIVIKRI